MADFGNYYFCLIELCFWSVFHTLLAFSQCLFLELHFWRIEAEQNMITMSYKVLENVMLKEREGPVRHV